MKTGVEVSEFEVRPSVSVSGRFLLTFKCDSCGNAGGVLSGHTGVALYCTHCVSDDNIKPRLELKPLRVEVRHG
jgi:hypothetical protein